MAISDKIVTKQRLQYFKGKIKALLDAKVSTVKVNGNALTMDANKAVNVPVPIVGFDTTGDPAKVHQITVSSEENKGITIEHGTSDVVYMYFKSGSSTVDFTDTLPTKTYVDNKISDDITTALAGVTGIEFVVVANVSALPATGETGKFYLVPNTGSGQNVYDEYVWVNKGTTETPNYAYEMIGSTAVDLTGYVQESDLNEITEAEIDAMFA